MADQPKPKVPIIIKMASYAAIASKPGVPVADIVVKATEDKQVGLEKEVMDWLSRMSEVTTGPDSLLRLMEVLRHEMEMPSGVPGFRGLRTPVPHRVLLLRVHPIGQSARVGLFLN